jgi:hypothetical protein
VREINYGGLWGILETVIGYSNGGACGIIMALRGITLAVFGTINSCSWVKLLAVS